MEKNGHVWVVKGENVAVRHEHTPEGGTSRRHKMLRDDADRLKNEKNGRKKKFAIVMVKTAKGGPGKQTFITGMTDGRTSRVQRWKRRGDGEEG